MKKVLFIFLAGIFILVACSKDDPDTSEMVELDTTPYVLNIGQFPDPDLPADNSLTKAKVQLGRMLFFEKKLSAQDNQSCATCHAQTAAFSDTAQFSIGTNNDIGNRQAMVVVNMAWNSNGFFWDGRSPSLRHQSLQPIINPVEMAETHENVIQKLSAEDMYRDQFIRAFGSSEITTEKMGLAMEQFMITIVSNDSKYDRYLAGSEVLTESENRGLDLFFAEYNPFFPDDSGADCAHCHSGINFENDQFMNNGMDTDAEFIDMGRFDVTSEEEDRAKFKVPSLRNIELSPPYMHDGRFQTLEEVVDHYNEGIQSSSTVDPAILNTMTTGLLLTDQDKVDLVNFLKTLTDQTFVNNEEYSDPF